MTDIWATLTGSHPTSESSLLYDSDLCSPLTSPARACYVAQAGFELIILPASKCLDPIGTNPDVPTYSDLEEPPTRTASFYGNLPLTWKPGAPPVSPVWLPCRALYTLIAIP